MATTQSVPEFCTAMFTWVQQQGEALRRLPASADNAEAIIKAYEAMFRTTNSLLERMNIPELPAAPMPVAPTPVAPTPMRTVISPREQIAAQVAQATRTAVSPRAAGALRTNKRVQKPAQKAKISLREYGYEMKKADRTKALRAAVKDRGAEVVSERLRFLNEVWGDNRKPEYLQNIKKDIEFVAGYRSDDMESDSDSDATS